MRQSVRRWLAGAGAVTAVGAAVLSQAGLSGTAMAATSGRAGRAAPAHAAAGQRTLARAAARSGAQANSATPAGWAPTKHIIYYGEDGGLVTRLQLRLRRLHYYPGKVD